MTISRVPNSAPSCPHGPGSLIGKSGHRPGECLSQPDRSIADEGHQGTQPEVGSHPVPARAGPRNDRVEADHGRRDETGHQRPDAWAKVPQSVGYGKDKAGHEEGHQAAVRPAAGCLASEPPRNGVRSIDPPRPTTPALDRPVRGTWRPASGGMPAPANPPSSRPVSGRGRSTMRLINRQAARPKNRNGVVEYWDRGSDQERTE